MPFSVKYGTSEQLPVVLLATHEGGGSDWLRKLVEVSTGYFVGIEDKQKQEMITFLSPITYYICSHIGADCLLKSQLNAYLSNVLFQKLHEKHEHIFWTKVPKKSQKEPNFVFLALRTQRAQS